MVSARPPPKPARGRIAYPSAATYTPGDVDASPQAHNSSHASALPAQGVFGIPLAESVQYASVQISTVGKDGALYVWGVVPVVVAKCGLHLKETATEVEGAFRISGSSKRMKELQTIFDSPPKYGKTIDFSAETFTAHDVATIFRRFLTQMPEPIIPLDLYESFRSTLSRPDNITQYRALIQSMPAINRYLLLYVLDLLYVFAKKSDINLMTAGNLALIFQPGVLSHPVHAMLPKEHVLSQQTLEFLIHHQDQFLERKTKTPTQVKADPDFMLPSDSDDEAPAGGYYLVDVPRRALPPPAPRRHTRLKPIQQGVTITASDSDDEAPPGGYLICEGEFRKNHNVVSRHKSMPARLRSKRD